MQSNEKGAAEAAALNRLDDLLAKGEITLTDSRYRIAKAAGFSPGGGFYIIAEKWLDLRRAALAKSVPPIDPALFDRFQADLDAASANAMKVFRDAIESVASEIDRTANLRVTDAEQRSAQGEREVDEILGDLERACVERTAFEKRVDELEAKLATASSENQRLRGRLEANERMIDRLTSHADPSRPLGTADMGDEQAVADDNFDAGGAPIPEPTEKVVANGGPPTVAIPPVSAEPPSLPIDGEHPEEDQPKSLPASVDQAGEA
ncbi:hypothetical protein [Qipengyuania sediminis]|uniref:hypothetical protein n=1 Tax=Qipengyuania sediminis TaxID=1532023 RepID=UPI00105A3965|nr:hypothetical protein [Qipengyuania sediminis]